MSQRHETMLIDDSEDVRPRIAGPRPAGTSRLADNPITLALVVAGVLVVLGLSFAVIGPLTGGSPSAQTLPAGPASGRSGGTVPTAAPTTGPTTQASLNPGTHPSSAAPSASVRFRPDELENGVVKLTNQARKQASCKDLRNNSRLHSVARAHSTDMAGTGVVSSTGSDGSSFADRARRAGYRDPLSENIARGQTTAADVVAYWLSHSATKAHLLDCAATNIGVGVAKAADGTFYWTQDFGK